MATDRQRDILRIALQEHVLQFETFDKNSAWALGERLKITCEKAAVATAIEIRLARETVFFTRDYACHGGSFPIQVKGGGCVGVVTVSGLPQRDDHILVVQVLAEMCGIAPSEVAF